MKRNLLIAILIIAFIVELGLTIGGFFLPAKTFELFKVGYNNDTAFLGYIVAWFLLLVTILMGIALWQVINNKNYATICYLLGFWWIGIGVGIYLMFGRTDNVALDSSKGLVLVLLTWWNKK